METAFEFEQVYNASIETVGDALTNEDKMRVRYFPQLKTFRPIAGFKIVFFNDESPYQKEWRVTKVEDGRLLAHSWV